MADLDLPIADGEGTRQHVCAQCHDRWSLPVDESAQRDVVVTDGTVFFGRVQNVCLCSDACEDAFVQTREAKRLAAQNH